MEKAHDKEHLITFQFSVESNAEAQWCSGFTRLFPLINLENSQHLKHLTTKWVNGDLRLDFRRSLGSGLSRSSPRREVGSRRSVGSGSWPAAGNRAYGDLVSHVFRALRSLFVFTLVSYWLLVIFSCVLIGRCDYFAFSFTTFQRKARENASDRVAIGCSFEFDWLRGRRDM